MSVRRRLEGLTIRDVGEEVLILDQASHQVHQLNHTASFIWRQCENETSPERIAAELARKFDIKIDVALDDVNRALAELRKLDLILAES